MKYRLGMRVKFIRGRSLVDELTDVGAGNASSFRLMHYISGEPGLITTDTHAGLNYDAINTL